MSTNVKLQRKFSSLYCGYEWLTWDLVEEMVPAYEVDKMHNINQAINSVSLFWILFNSIHYIVWMVELLRMMKRKVATVVRFTVQSQNSLQGGEKNC
jgi:hypothetical protein